MSSGVPQSGQNRAVRIVIWTVPLLVLDRRGRFVRDVVDDAGDVLQRAGDPALEALERRPVEFLGASGHPVARLDRADRDDPAVDAVVTLHARGLADDRRERLPRIVLL